ncbi:MULTISPECIES: hypothetical protein [Roseivirga]|jgi:membrane protein implicated in regulation of membrane protease activity|uniref:Uncharacterized protein n=1 Tax=Roseivirga thermotolerans TaxID=1758176 RepID=A0ABQ3I734_9BACT|nr:MULTISPECIES: hypothetical protein [Roseivirga]MEC7754052.1 hypothetical protein [Bacteroidota bacterium]GHE61067.1 hypothetical protein GCM10011340_14990 [Roseivirga thermotolerans]|tara:strand:+ start:5804 stop:6247 length:444 start_codon:yes stop_codon:yes gene_type:complete
MSYRENKNLVNIVSAIAVPAIYFFFIFKNSPYEHMDTAELLKFWGKEMMTYILVAIGVRIGIEILYSVLYAVITRESIPKTDERDKIIELKSKNISQVIFIFGIIAGMGSLALEMSVNTFFLAFLIGGVIAEIVENLVQLFYYQRGF